jgi:Galactose oxidase, central domain/Kelch motif
VIEMDDLRSRFATLDRVPVPDVWTAIERRLERLGAASTGRHTPVELVRRAGIATLPSHTDVVRRQRAFGRLAIAVLVAALLLGGAIVVGSSLLRLTPAPTPDASVSLDGPSVSADLFGAGSWTPTGTMNEGRFGETATLLPDGHVLVAGGSPSGGEIPSTSEVYDPTSRRWTAAGTMIAGSAQGHSATLLPDGRVLVAGGDQVGPGHPPQNSAQLYDPVTRTWTATGSMLNSRSHHVAVPLPDGRVLVAGGTGSDYRALAQAEVYDPATGTWTATGDMLAARAGPSGSLLPDGTLLVVGRSSADGLETQSAELYEPRSGAWTAAPSFAGAGGCRVAESLQDRRVLVVCAEDGGARTSATLYDQGTNAWTSTQDPPNTCCVGEAGPRGSTVGLADGRVLWKGLIDAGELYDPASATWVSAGGPTYPAEPSWALPYTSTTEGAGYYADTLTLLQDDTVLMTTLGAALVYDPDGRP